MKTIGDFIFELHCDFSYKLDKIFPERRIKRAENHLKGIDEAIIEFQKKLEEAEHDKERYEKMLKCMMEMKPKVQEILERMQQGRA